MSDFVPWPQSVVPRNLTGTACDMLIGPCACGATHTAQEAALAMHERDESDVRTVINPIAIEREACAQVCDSYVAAHPTLQEAAAQAAKILAAAIRARR